MDQEMKMQSVVILCRNNLILISIFTPKEWFLSKKGPKEGERVARGHFHERVGETPVHWLPPGVGITPIPFSVSENGPFEKFLGFKSIFTSQFHSLNTNVD